MRRLFWEVCEKIVLKDANWIYIAQDRVQWPALANTEMNLQFP
jgi:hypothetical protein